MIETECLRGTRGGCQSTCVPQQCGKHD